MVVHLLKLHGWSDLSACRHWRGEIVAFQTHAARRFSPSMRRRIDVDALYARAVRQVEQLALAGRPGRTPPSPCPVTLDQLLNADVAELEAAFSAAA